VESASWPEQTWQTSWVELPASSVVRGRRKQAACQRNPRTGEFEEPLVETKEGKR